jgi:hypothetical protein
MIDWAAKVRDLKRMADELELVASRAEGRAKMLLGRNVDELRLFAAQIERVLRAEAVGEDDPPPGEPLVFDWLPPDEEE